MTLKRNSELLFFFFMFISNALFSQKETNNWFFGYNAGLNFNGALPLPISGGQVSSLECNASVSDSSGNLLFYTDGTFVWDKTHNLMPNGFGLIASESSTQGALIIKKPQSVNIYYIFNIDAFCLTSFVYSIVDLNANGGLGDVISKNNILLSKGNYFEKLTAVKHCNNRDIWIIMMGQGQSTLLASKDGGKIFPNNNKPVNLYCFLLTPYGISNYPTITSLGNLNSAVCFGQLKSSAQGKQLAFGSNYGYAILNFDKANGNVSSIKENALSIETGYGLEFSPDGKLLYFNNQQIEIRTGNKVNMGKPVLSQFQLASDNKVYFINNDSLELPFTDNVNAFNRRKQLSVINNPNAIGPSCNITYNTVSLGSDSAQFGLPNFPSYHFYHPLGEFTYQNDCIGNTTSFMLVQPPLLDSIKWLFYDNNTSSNSLSPTHVYWIAGNYKVDVITYKNGISDTVSQCVTINGSSTDFLGRDKVICSGESIMIGAPAINIGNYLWSTGDTTAGIIVNAGGDYSLQVTNNCTTYSDVIHVEEIYCDPEIFIPNVFTPNIDNINDEFMINIKNIKEITFTIYDRWGLKMKEIELQNLTTAYQSISLWDGRTAAGLTCTDGVYYYTIIYKSYQDKELKTKGFLTLLR